MERLDKLLCDSGTLTRSQARALVRAGRVCVNGTVERDPGRKTQSSAVTLDGMPLGGGGRRVLLLNKPGGFVTATTDARERTVMELLPPEHRDLKPVGRLDKLTEGLLLFTDDGALLHRLISPKKEVQKVYYARHEGQATEADVQAYARGLTLGDGTVCRSALLQPLGAGESLVTLCEGKYHQVRRMMASRGLLVTWLCRRQEAFLTLEGLQTGQWRLLAEDEIEKLDNCAK